MMQPGALEPDPWRVILQTHSAARAAEAELVLLAVGVPVRWHRELRLHLLEVPDASAGHARRQLLLHRLENRPAPPAPAAPVVDDGRWGVGGFLTVILGLPLLLRLAGHGAPAIDAGLLSAGAFRDGEFWRAVTALTLHGDVAHVAGNAMFGSVFAIFLGRLVGSGVGWFAVLCAAACANAANGWLQAEAFRSLGASTATFAALGVVGAVAALRQRRRQALPSGLRPFRDWGPLLAAFGLLAFTGSGAGPDDDTDVTAHVFGFFFGAVAGAMLAAFAPDRFERRSLQLGAGVLAALVVALAWLAALGSID